MKSWDRIVDYCEEKKKFEGKVNYSRVRFAEVKNCKSLINK